MRALHSSKSLGRVDVSRLDFVRSGKHGARETRNDVSLFYSNDERLL